MNDKAMWTRRPDETDDQYLWRLGSLKEAGLINLTWPQLAIVLNTYTPNLKQKLSAEDWVAKFNKLAEQIVSNDAMDVLTGADSVEEEVVEQLPVAVGGDLTIPDEEVQSFEAEKMLVRLRDARLALMRLVRTEARADSILSLFRDEIKKFDAKEAPVVQPVVDESFKAVYALLSDVHYGLSFSNAAGAYNSDIARERVMKYAAEIVNIGKLNNATVCYVSMLGDMISGNIHKPIQIENRESVIEQVVGVSELVADFIRVLADAFDYVYVNSVSGNHSRLESIAENAMRAEKLDSLVPWYCKTKLENVKNVVFEDNTVDATVCTFDICGKFFAGVHGDYDKDIEKSAMCFERLCGKPLDYMIVGHLHVPNILLKDRGYIRNGSVVGSGDEYTMKNRLFSNPYQICMTVGSNGVESIWPVQL